MRTFTISVSIAVVSAFWALPALADVPPPEGYVETCTVAKQVTATTECLACGAYYGATTRCQTMLEPFCYGKACRSYGSSGWTEVYCRTKNASAPAIPQEITDALPLATTPVPSVPNPGACPASATSTSTGTATATVATGTGTATETATSVNPVAEKTDDSGCSLGTGNALRTLGPWSIVLVGLLLAALRRRRK
jgi:hypothetical protein